MQFESLDAFIHMGGHGIYVWTVYILGVLTIFLNIVRPKQLLNQFIKAQGKMRRMRSEQAGSDS